jgi:hypothetical protein
MILSDTLGYAGNNRVEKEVEHYVFPDLALRLENLFTKASCFGKAIVSVMNQGNVAMVPSVLELWVDQEQVDGYFEVPALEPGASASMELDVADSLHPLDPGIHAVRVLLLVSDSVSGNNEVFGSLECEGSLDADYEGVSAWIIYPNPSQGSIRLHMQEAAGPGSAIRLLAADGRILQTFLLAEGEHIQVLELGNLEAGMYLLREKKGGRSARLVISR